MNSPTKERSSSSVIVDVSDTSVHPNKVLEWRQDEFRRLGFAEYIADFLASTKIDLTQMEQLLKRGCQHDYALQILMGTQWSGDDEKWNWTDEDMRVLYEQSP